MWILKQQNNAQKHEETIKLQIKWSGKMNGGSKCKSNTAVQEPEEGRKTGKAYISRGLKKGQCAFDSLRGQVAVLRRQLEEFGQVLSLPLEQVYA